MSTNLRLEISNCISTFARIAHNSRLTTRMHRKSQLGKSNYSRKNPWYQSLYSKYHFYYSY